MIGTSHAVSWRQIQLSFPGTPIAPSCVEKFFCIKLFKPVGRKLALLGKCVTLKLQQFALTSV